LINKFHKNNYWVYAALVVVAIVAISFLNYLYANNYPGGKYFQTQWISTRGVLTEGLSPYADQLLYQVQVSAYGRPAMVGEYEFRFMYPYFSLIIFTPFGLIKDFVIARAFWMTFLELLLIGIYFLSMNLANWKTKLLPGIALFLISITFYHNIRAVVDGNLVIVVTFFMLASLMAIRDRKDEAAGLLLAITTLEIKYFILGLVLILIYLLVNKRFKVIWYLLGGIVILYGFSFLLLPDWLAGYVQQLALSITHDPLSSLSLVLRNYWGEVGVRISITLTIITAIVMLFEWFFIRIATFKYFLWILFITLVISQWSGFPADASNFISLFPGLIFSLKLITDRWQNKGEGIVLIIASSLYLCTWIIFFILGDENKLYYETGLFFIMMPVVEFILLYWSRWWVIRAKTVSTGPVK
jgi:hypothetical protein